MTFLSFGYPLLNITECKLPNVQLRPMERQTDKEMDGKREDKEKSEKNKGSQSNL